MRRNALSFGLFGLYFNDLAALVAPGDRAHTMAEPCLAAGSGSRGSDHLKALVRAALAGT